MTQRCDFVNNRLQQACSFAVLTAVCDRSSRQPACGSPSLSQTTQRAGGDGTDRVIRVEQFEFVDGTYALDQLTAMARPDLLL